MFIFLGRTDSIRFTTSKFQSTVEGIYSARDIALDNLEIQVSNLLSIDVNTVETFEESPIAVLEQLMTFRTHAANEISLRRNPDHSK